MNVLFVGFGDLAKRTTPLLLKRGWTVTGLRRSSEVVEGVNMIQGDCGDPLLMAELLEAADIVVVTLTAGSFNEQAYRDSYVATSNLLRETIPTLKAKPKCLLWVSSTSVYGQRNGEWVNESSETNPVGFSGKCLLEAEKNIENCGVSFSIIRFSGIYRPGTYRLIDQVLKGECVPEQPEQWSNRIHGDDCAGVLDHLAGMWAAGKPLAPVYLASDSEPVLLHNVQRWLAEKLNTDIKPGKPRNARGNRRCDNSKLLAAGYKFTYPTFREGYQHILDSRAGAKTSG